MMKPLQREKMAKFGLLFLAVVGCATVVLYSNQGQDQQGSVLTSSPVSAYAGAGSLPTVETFDLIDYPSEPVSTFSASGFVPLPTAHPVHAPRETVRRICSSPSSHFNNRFRRVVNQISEGEADSEPDGEPDGEAVGRGTNADAEKVETGFRRVVNQRYTTCAII